MAWGSSWSILWGGGAPGGGPPPVGGFFVVAATASGSSTFQVAFSEQPLFVSPLRSGDASNLARWSLIRLDTGAAVPLLFIRAVSGVPLVLEFGIIGRFMSALVRYQITGDFTLVSAIADPIINPRSATFAGSPFAATVPQARGLRDMRNPQSSRDHINGGLVVRSSGDYDLEGGLVLLRKLILRRLTTLPHEFYHLSNRDYGGGAEQKGFFTTADIVALQAATERQVLREPEVAEASATVTLTPDGRLTRQVRARVRRTGETLAITSTMQIGASGG